MQMLDNTYPSLPGQLLCLTCVTTRTQDSETAGPRSWNGVEGRLVARIGRGQQCPQSVLRSGTCHSQRCQAILFQKRLRMEKVSRNVKVILLVMVQWSRPFMNVEPAKGRYRELNVVLL